MRSGVSLLFVLYSTFKTQPFIPRLLLLAREGGSGTGIPLLASDRAFHYSDHRTWMWPSRRAGGQGTCI